MSLRLIDHLETSLTPRQLTVEELRPAPDPVNPWAVFCAWCVDWMIAFALAKIAVSSWMGFLGPLGLDHLSRDARFLVTAYSERTSLILAPIFFFTMSFVGVMFHSMTPGLRLFRHRVESSSIASSLVWSWASTVSLAALGMPLLTNWLDRGAVTETRSEQHHLWLLNRTHAVEWGEPNLLTFVRVEPQRDENIEDAA